MDTFLESFFGPLSKDYCLYFYILSIVGFVLLTMMLASTLMIGITKRKGIEFYLQAVSIAIAYGIFYFQNRLLYSMCVGNQ